MKKGQRIDTPLQDYVNKLRWKRRCDSHNFHRKLSKRRCYARELALARHIGVRCSPSFRRRVKFKIRAYNLITPAISSYNITKELIDRYERMMLKKLGISKERFGQ